MVTTHIAVTGAHHTGKSLLARRIGMELRATGYTVTRVHGLAKSAVKRGFPKMTRHTAASAEWIMTAWAAATLEAELSVDVVVSEHSPADAVAYWLAALDHRGEQVESDVLRRSTTLAAVLTDRADAILATTIDSSLPLGHHPDKDPDYVDERYRRAVDEHLHRFLAQHAVDHHLVRAGHEGDAVHVAMTTAMER